MDYRGMAGIPVHLAPLIPIIVLVSLKVTLVSRNFSGFQ
jgi:hypothetical protein